MSAPSTMLRAGRRNTAPLSTCLEYSSLFVGKNGQLAGGEFCCVRECLPVAMAGMIPACEGGAGSCADLLKVQQTGDFLDSVDRVGNMSFASECLGRRRCQLCKQENKMD